VLFWAKSGISAAMVFSATPGMVLRFVSRLSALAIS